MGAGPESSPHPVESGQSFAPAESVAERIGIPGVHLRRAEVESTPLRNLCGGRLSTATVLWRGGRVSRLDFRNSETGERDIVRGSQVFFS